MLSTSLWPASESTITKIPMPVSPGAPPQRSPQLLAPTPGSSDSVQDPGQDVPLKTLYCRITSSLNPASTRALFMSLIGWISARSARQLGINLSILDHDATAKVGSMESPLSIHKMWTKCFWPKAVPLSMPQARAIAFSLALRNSTNSRWPAPPSKHGPIGTTTKRSPFMTA